MAPEASPLTVALKDHVKSPFMLAGYAERAALPVMRYEAEICGPCFATQKIEGDIKERFLIENSRRSVISN